MKTASSSAKYHSALVTTLIKAITVRFGGFMENLQILHPSNALSETTSKPFSEKVYIIAAAMDPNYGFVWLESDHPGSDQH